MNGYVVARQNTYKHKLYVSIGCTYNYTGMLQHPYTELVVYTVGVVCDYCRCI